MFFFVFHLPGCPFKFGLSPFLFLKPFPSSSRPFCRPSALLILKSHSLRSQVQVTLVAAALGRLRYDVAWNGRASKASVDRERAAV
jgi:hypothetical protein